MNIQKLIIITTLISLCFGCKTKQQNTNEYENLNTTTNISFSAFNDEKYIWESWTFSTNEVHNLE